MKKPMKKTVKKADGGMAYTGGTKNFNEETGQYFGYNKEPKPPIQPRRPERPSSWSYGDQKPPIQPRRPERPIAGFAGRGQGLMNAIKNANPNARFKRDDDFEENRNRRIRPMPPVVTPGGGGGTGPIMRPSISMPLRRAKGGMADGGKWIQSAIKKPGALRSALGAKKGEPIPAAKLEKATHSKNPKMAKRANLAMTLRGMKKK